MELKYTVNGLKIDFSKGECGGGPSGLLTETGLTATLEASDCDCDSLGMGTPF